MRSRGTLWALALVLLMVPGVACADDGRLLTAEAPEVVQMARLDLVEVPLTCTPASIECGKQCGMTEMCGLDPCLCGPVDEFGACACNGKQTVTPTFALADDDAGRVGLVDLFGTAYLVPLADGPADIEVHASLPHHADAVSTIHIEVAPWGVLDVLKIAGVVLVVAAIVAGAVFGVRALIKRRRA